MKKLNPKRQKAMIKYFTYNLLKLANSKAAKKKYNRQLSNDFFKKTDRKTKFPVTFSFVHTDGAIRCVFVYDEKGNSAIIDVEPKLYSKLPTYNSKVGKKNNQVKI